MTKHLGIETRSHVFTMAGGLTSNAVWLKPIGAPDTITATIILNDMGKRAAADQAANRLNRGEQVLALDLPFHGDAWNKEENYLFQQIIHSTGDRPLGIEAAHLIELATWLKSRGAGKVRLETSGMRNQVVALVASALEPAMFSEVVVHHGIPSLRYLLDKPVAFQDAPDLFCLDLYKFTDLDRLAALSSPTIVKTETTD